MPMVAEGSGDAVVIVGGSTTRVKVSEPVFAVGVCASVTVMVKTKAPPEGGVPVRLPVPAFSVSQPGTPLPVTVKGDTPPVHCG